MRAFGGVFVVDDCVVEDGFMNGKEGKVNRGGDEGELRAEQ
jgi:hypothetical protein